MRVFTGVESVPEGFGPSAVTIGKFDGLHTGHRVVIDDLLELAGDDLLPVVVTFDRNPLELLRPDRCPAPLVGLDQKLELLESVGVAATVVLRFDDALAALEPEAFVDRILLGPLGMRRLLVGDDFRFGHRGRGDVALLERMGAERGFVVRVQRQVTVESRRVSSTWIRELLGAGAIEEAARLLGRAPAVRGEVVHGAHRGRELGFPTANLAQQSDGMIPADGVYAGRLVDRSADPVATYPAAISVGSNPTFEGVPPRQVEAHVLDRTLDLYGHLVDVEFTHRIRGQVAYEGVDPLIAQIAVDVGQVRALVDRPQ
ncbi:bifunctional riboflavin kinase/FAD synthetase [Amnibacterium kyonggiense]|uniref:Riboflavin biosynthesis protein n=1 Tax=Amnibacterium kyonggiense TaxID=595671 RepID=A0A4R7FGD1_9MICO|nr:bifunctional riboflavin kinase/FAD synthetase [Amnibacterium kyonggiense]TDS75725.1 riboflavin kinase/FMN adenylyltransferase [Amnibacterium kyonggiense]